MTYVQVHHLVFEVATERPDVAAFVAGTVAATIHQAAGHVPAADFGLPPVSYRLIPAAPADAQPLDLVALTAAIAAQGPRTPAQAAVLPVATAACQRCASWLRLHS